VRRERVSLNGTSWELVQGRVAVRPMDGNAI
jgi:hypothetical protein